MADIAAVSLAVSDPAAYFPDYAGLKRMSVASTTPSAKTFADYAELWQASINDKAAATREDYKKILNRVWMRSLGIRPIAAIRYSDLLSVPLIFRRWQERRGTTTSSHFAACSR
jgi:hypothetical protein